MTNVYCQTDLGLGMLPGLRTLDHILPRDLGGSNETHNLVTSCGRCNGSRGSGPLLGWVRRQFPEQWFEVLERVSEAQDKPLAPLDASALNLMRQSNRVLA